MNKLLDEMVRDFTAIPPQPKSEVRRRIEEYRVGLVSDTGKAFMDGVQVRDLSGSELRRIRRAADVTQQELADSIGRTKSWIAHIEAGRRKLPLEIQIKIEKYLKNAGL